MKSIIWVLLILLGIFPLCSFAQDEGDLVSVSISEVMLNPLEYDLQWVELYNASDEFIDLSEWALKNKADDEFLLSYFIAPEQYLVIPFEDFFETTDTISLLHLEDESIEEWTIETEFIPGQSIVFAENQLIATHHPTAGRPNLLLEETICPEIDTESDDMTENTDDEKPMQPLESGAIIINEVFANPLGDEIEGEFIELYNTENRSINLEQWVLEDASKQYILPAVIIDPHQYLLLKRTTTSIALNNGNESVALTDPFQREVHQLVYEKATEGKSWNYQAIDNWYEQFPTPGNANSEPEIEEEEEEKEEPVNVEDAPNEEDSEEETTNHESFENQKEEEIDENVDQIRLSELLPNPEGSDSQEWIELENPTNISINLEGLTVKDTAKSYQFEDGMIGPGEFFLLHREESSIALNNSNETISLFVDDVITDEFHYETSQENISWARFNSGWKETMVLTPEEENVFKEETKATAVSNKSTTKVKSSSKKEDLPRTISFEQWSQIEEKEQVVIEGVITALSGTFQKRTAILQSIDLEEPIAIELYFHKAEWPDLTIGQLATITGVKSITQNGDRLLIKDKDAIVLKETFIVNAVKFDAAANYVFATMTGTLIEQTQKELLLEYNNDELLITPPLHLETIEQNSLVTVSGIVKEKNGIKSLHPRSKDDIQYTKAPSPFVQEEETLLSLEENAKKDNPGLLIGFGGTVVTGVIGGLYRKELQEFLLTIFQRNR